MKAVLWTGYGSPDVLTLTELPTPTPKENEVLVRVYAVTASTPDSEIRRLKFPSLFAIPIRIYFGFFKPTRKKILGTEFAGEIVSVGKDVTGYQPGDQVYGYTGLGLGTYAEYMCLAEKQSGIAGVMAPKPVNMTYAEAAALPFGGLEALNSIRKVNVQAGKKVLIVGAGGTIGTYCVQLAKHHGAEVTGVDKSGKLEMIRSIGADHVIDCTKEDFTKNGQTYDVIIDTIGKSPFWGSVRSLKDGGIYLLDNPGLLSGVWARMASKRNNKKVLTWTSGYSTKNLLTLKEMVEAGTIKPVVDRVYPLEQIVEAHRFVDSGEKKGNVVVKVGE